MLASERAGSPGMGGGSAGFSTKLVMWRASSIAITTTLARVTTPGGDYRFAVTERKAGRAPELEHPDTLEWIGRFIGRLHAVGRRQPFQHRHVLNPAADGARALALLCDGGFVPAPDKQYLIGIAQLLGVDPAIGLLAGSMTNPPGLAFATSVVGSTPRLSLRHRLSAHDFAAHPLRAGARDRGRPRPAGRGGAAGGRAPQCESAAAP